MKLLRLLKPQNAKERAAKIQGEGLGARDDARVAKSGLKTTALAENKEESLAANAAYINN